MNNPRPCLRLYRPYAISLADFAFEFTTSHVRRPPRAAGRFAHDCKPAVGFTLCRSAIHALPLEENCRICNRRDVDVLQRRDRYDATSRIIASDTVYQAMIFHSPQRTKAR